MNRNRSVLLAFGLLVLVSAFYRVWEGRPYGFAPQIAMALFGGAVVANKRLAFVLPIISMLLSDVLYELLFINGLSEIQGFYEGQWLIYVLIAGLTLLGFLLKKISVLRIAGFSLSASVLYFFASNFFVWLGGGGLGRPKTWDGLVLCYNDALAFYRDYGLVKGFSGNFIFGDLFFCAILFGGFYLLNSWSKKPQRQLAS